MESFNPLFRIDITNKRFQIPKRIRNELNGKEEVKIYTSDSLVNQWIAGLNDTANWETGEPIHPFLLALGDLGLCQGSGIRSHYVVTNPIQGESENTHLATFFVLDEDGKIVGVSVVTENNERPEELYREVTCTGVRKKGYGKLLDEAIHRFAKEKGKKIIRLSPANSTARMIHTKMGFVNNTTVKNNEGRHTMKKNVKGGRRKTHKIHRSKN